MRYKVITKTSNDLYFCYPKYVGCGRNYNYGNPCKKIKK